MRKRLKAKVRARTYLINGDHVTAVSIPWFINSKFNETLASFTSTMGYFEFVIEETTQELEMMNKAIRAIQL